MLEKLLKVRMLAAAVPAVLLALLPAPSGANNHGAAPLAGRPLYAEHCATCHGSLEKSLLSNRSASRIRSAIRLLPAMSGLEGLTDAELEAIAAALAPASPR